ARVEDLAGEVGRRVGVRRFGAGCVADRESRAALHAELGAGRVLVLAPGTLHSWSPFFSGALSQGSGQYAAWVVRGQGAVAAARAPVVAWRRPFRGPFQEVVMPGTLTSKRFRVDDLAAAVDFCFERGWTDGLPVIPPTESSVRAMLDAAELAPDAKVGYVRDRFVTITAEKVAINAVMAGCKPEYMPVVVAAVEGIADERWGYHGPGTSTGGAAVLMIVNGPIVRELDINAGDNLFGPGWRSNLTIGRAVRLVMRNVCGSMPGLLDRGTVGHPGKLSYVIAEKETESPWTPLHVERGLRPEQSAVTVIAAEGPHQFYNQLSNTAEGILTTLSDSVRISGNGIGQPHYCPVIA